jgi:hypothetical protein
MEVHHHPDVHKKDKHFREYILEFLMIFLAVSLGFISENLREHLTDRAKEKEYIERFIHNLETDTANLRSVANFDTRQVGGIDSFLMLAHAPMTVNENRKNFYGLFIRYLSMSAVFTSQDITLQQLKSTGDYRLIIRDHVADSLAEYDADVQGIYQQSGYYRKYYDEILALWDQEVDMTVFSDTAFFRNNRFTDKPLPFVNDPARLRQLFNKAWDFRNITDYYGKNMIIPELRKATGLIVFLKKEYHLA